MKQSNDFAHDMIDLDVHTNRLLYTTSEAVQLSSQEGSILIKVKLQGMVHRGTFQPIEKRQEATLILSSYGDKVLRLATAFGNEQIEKNSVMLDLDPTMVTAPLHFAEDERGNYLIYDQKKRVRARIITKVPPVNKWSDLQRKSDSHIQIEFFPDGDEHKPIRLASYDHFFPGKLESVPLGYITDNDKVSGTLFSIIAEPDDLFFGTGERFGNLNLTGRTIILENTDALGTASKKSYKNVPFFFSSAGYGIFFHSTAHMRLSFADISNRAVQALIEESRLDLFLIGGQSPERIINNYRRLTGFSPELPLWSYGMWMSRMSYFSSDEVEGVAKRLREEGYPCDVLHLDSGYFSKDWVCDWKFSETRFPNANQFIERLRQKGFHLSVWQTPNIGKDNPLYQEATEKGYLPIISENEQVTPISDFSGQNFGGQIDFTNEEAVKWYQNLLRGLFDIGVECIKTDFGEKIVQHASFKNMEGERLHNIYSLLYHKAAFETAAEYSKHPFIWARSTWAGGQRYPLHWGGDTASIWHSLASTLRGGLQLGLSGYTFWSHDIPGFHGLPEFMNSWPSDELYLRWTQFGVFTSHMRYHGTSPREPWHYQSVASMVRQWLIFRYTIIPYILQEAAWCLDKHSGRAMIVPLFFDYGDDPNTWNIDNQYLFGRDILVAPIMNEEGVRNIYLPQGRWIELYSGKVFEGNCWLKKVHYPLAAIPVFVKMGTSLPIYPEVVDSTDDMDLQKVRFISFGDTTNDYEQFKNLVSSTLGKLSGFTAEQVAINFNFEC